MPSVLQPWVEELPLRAQGTLLTVVRNCDISEKVVDQCSIDRQLVAFLRYCFLVPADPREVDYPCAWFQTEPPEFKQSLFGHFPLHWYTHIMHACEVIGFYHPDGKLRNQAFHIYDQFVHGLHLNGEGWSQFINRIEEDRIKHNTVVS